MRKNFSAKKKTDKKIIEKKKYKNCIKEIYQIAQRDLLTYPLEKVKAFI